MSVLCSLGNGASSLLTAERGSVTRCRRLDVYLNKEIWDGDRRAAIGCNESKIDSLVLGVMMGVCTCLLQY